MKLSEISIQRPVLATVMSLILVLVGVIGVSKLSVREYPDIDPPVVSVSTTYLGASAEVMESTITELLEDELIGIEGIRSMISTSRDEVSNIVIEFKLERNVDVAAQDVRDRVSRARGRLPDDIEEPVISKQDTDANAIMWLGLGGEGFSQLQLTDYADRYIIDQLQTVSGVGRVIIGGAREYAMRLWLDPLKMAARGITAQDVDEALANKNVELPSGRVEGVNREFTVRTLGELQTAEEFNRLIIKRVDGVPVYLRDIGMAEIGPRSDRTLVRFGMRDENGDFTMQTAVGLGVVKQSKANTLDVASGVKEKIKEIIPHLPKGMTLKTAYDSSVFIQDSINEVVQTLAIAFVLVVAVIYLFLGNFRATLIPAVSIPISLITTFALMYALGYTINILTLLALTLAIGLVVDDNIVVLENIYRRMELGEAPMEAAVKGIREIAFAVIATTAALVAVFLPIVFMEGVTGRLLKEFSVVLAGSVIVSAFVALTLSPMLCSRWLKPVSMPDSGLRGESRLEAIKQGFRRWIDRVNSWYARTLPFSFQLKGWIATGMVVMLLACAAMYFFMPKGFLPFDDRSNIFTWVKSPEGSTLKYTSKAIRKAEAVYTTTPEVERVFSVIALSQGGVGQVNQGFMFVGLVPPHERDKKQKMLVGELFPKLGAIPEALVFPNNPPSGPNRGFGGQVQMSLLGDNIDDLVVVAGRVLQRAQREVPELVNARTDLTIDKPQLSIRINREKAATLGVSVRDIARSLQIFLAGDALSTFKVNSKRYDVVAQAFPEDRLTPSQLATIYVEGTTLAGEAQLVPLTSVIDFEEKTVPPAIGHYNRRRAVTIDGSLAPDPTISLGNVLEKLAAIAEEEMAPEMEIAWKGESKEYFDAGYAFIFAFVIAVAVVFLVLAAQFESWRDPFIVMFTVPLAVCGAIFTLFGLVYGSFFIQNAASFLMMVPFIRDVATVDFSLNVFSQIGIVLLVGLVTKNGILIVEFANQIRENHPELTVREAVIEAAGVRFRPILMTSIATILGALPIAIGLGTGIDSRKPLGAVIVGGMIFATLLTFYVIPVVYEVLTKKGLVTKRLSDHPTEIETMSSSGPSSTR